MSRLQETRKRFFLADNSIEQQLISQSTCCTKTFCLRASRLGGSHRSPSAHLGGAAERGQLTWPQDDPHGVVQVLDRRDKEQQHYGRRTGRTALPKTRDAYQVHLYSGLTVQADTSQSTQGHPANAEKTIMFSFSHLPSCIKPLLLRFQDQRM